MEKEIEKAVDARTCKYNGGVLCEVQKCEKCGFNPTEARRRHNRLRASATGKLNLSVMTIDRACEILDPEHREQYESIEPVNEACRMGIKAMREQQKRKQQQKECRFCNDYKIRKVAPYENGLQMHLCNAVYCFHCGAKIEEG